jgi:membrane protein
MATRKHGHHERCSLGGMPVTAFVKHVLRKVWVDDCLGKAAQLSYAFLFALFPFLLFLTTLLGYLPFPNLMEEIMALLAAVLPGEVMHLIQDNIRTLVNTQHGGLLSLGIFAALWTAASAIMVLIDTLNRAYGVQEGRPFWKVWGIAILLTIGLPLFMLASMGLLVFGPQLGGWIAAQIGLGTLFQVLWDVLRWLVILVLLIVALAPVYYCAPDVVHAWRWITPGSVFAILATLITSLGFSYYVTNLGSYDATYGSIGAVIVLLTWMYLTGFFILVGGEINAEIAPALPAGKISAEKAPGEKTEARGAPGGPHAVSSAVYTRCGVPHLWGPRATLAGLVPGLPRCVTAAECGKESV